MPDFFQKKKCSCLFFIVIFSNDFKWYFDSPKTGSVWLNINVRLHSNIWYMYVGIGSLIRNIMSISERNRQFVQQTNFIYHFTITTLRIILHGLYVRHNMIIISHVTVVIAIADWCGFNWLQFSENLHTSHYYRHVAVIDPYGRETLHIFIRMMPTRNCF